MEELKKIFAENLIYLRGLKHLTQFELGEKLNYSDKAVSRWERAEAIPDAYVLMQLSKLFNVTVDYLLTPHSPEEAEKVEKLLKKAQFNRKIITTISFLGVWSIALLIFIILFLVGKTYWITFAYALPVSLIVLLVFNSIWGKKKNNFYIISLFIWSVFFWIYFALFSYNLWPLFILGVPAQIITFLCFQIKRSSKK
ncbi:MAG: helix-turn-helix transcriptional regulator [Ruminococcaceae bacterium]|nr:helix-turn-helix transcriptional regulator [Oscillospiraceae bacterium]